MEQPTTAQRNAIYKEALRRTDIRAPFMCNNIYFAMGDLYGGDFANKYDPDETQLRYFPEILKHKPNDVELGESWFEDDIKPRIAILKQAIAETE